MRHFLRTLTPVVVWLVVTPGTAECQVDMHELLQILRIHTWRIRMPVAADQVWNVATVKDSQLHTTGKRPLGLTPTATRLFAFREIGNDRLEFTLSDWKKASQGTEDLCKLGADCAQPYEPHWKEAPSYSADGEQCILGEITYKSNDHEKLFIVLERVKNAP